MSRIEKNVFRPTYSHGDYGPGIRPSVDRIKKDRRAYGNNFSAPQIRSTRIAHGSHKDSLDFYKGYMSMQKSDSHTPSIKVQTHRSDSHSRDRIDAPFKPRSDLKIAKPNIPHRPPEADSKLRVKPVAETDENKATVELRTLEIKSNQTSTRDGRGNRLRGLIGRAVDNQIANDKRARMEAGLRAERRKGTWVKSTSSPRVKLAFGVGAVMMAASNFADKPGIVRADRARVTGAVGLDVATTLPPTGINHKDGDVGVRLRFEASKAVGLNISANQAIEKYIGSINPKISESIVQNSESRVPVNDNNNQGLKPLLTETNQGNGRTPQVQAGNNEKTFVIPPEVPVTIPVAEVKAETISSQVVDMIKASEAWSASVYPDPVGLPTVGYGHLVREGENYPRDLTLQEGEDLLRKDIEAAQNAIRELVYVPLNQNQFDALTSFVFNLGRGAFEESTLRRELNNGNFDRIPSEIIRWNKAYDKESKTYIVLIGLVNRRAEEIRLWITPSDEIIQPVTEAPKIDETVKVIDGIEVKAIDPAGHMLRVDLADAFLKAQELAGGIIEVNSAMRTYADQKRLYTCWAIEKNPRCNPANDPDTNPSNHQRGLAVDIQNWANPVVDDAMRRAGFYKPYPDPRDQEQHHFEMLK